MNKDEIKSLYEMPNISPSINVKAPPVTIIFEACENIRLTQKGLWVEINFEREQINNIKEFIINGNKFIKVEGLNTELTRRTDVWGTELS